MQRGAALLALLADYAPLSADLAQPTAASNRWTHSVEYDGLAAAVAAATSGQLPPGLAPAIGSLPPPPSDKRLAEQV